MTDSQRDQPGTGDLYRVIAERRDVRNGFRPDPIPDDVLTRVLSAAHQAPSVGLSQPWDFLLLRDRAVRERVHALARRQQDAYAATLPGARARAFRDLKVEAILDTPLNVVVTCDPTRGGRHVLGRHAQPQVAAYSAACAVQNLWLAARAENLGVGWVSFFAERDLAAALDLPAHLDVDRLPVRGLRGRSSRPRRNWCCPAGRSGGRWPGRCTRASGAAAACPASRPPGCWPTPWPRSGRWMRRPPAQARERQEMLTKPSGSLGVLESVSVQLAGIAGECPPPLPEPAVVAVFAGRPRGARPGRHPVAAGGHRADGGQLPGLGRGGERDRRAGRRGGVRGGRRGGRRPAGRPRAAAAQGPAAARRT